MLENSFSQRVNAVISKTRELRRGPYWPHLYVVKEDGEPALRLWALSSLIQDRAEQTSSYPQFLTQLKEKVRGPFVGRLPLTSWTGKRKQLFIEGASAGPVR